MIAKKVLGVIAHLICKKGVCLKILLIRSNKTSSTFSELVSALYKQRIMDTTKAIATDLRKKNY